MPFNILPRSITGRIVLLIIFISVANVMLTWIFSIQFTKKVEMKQTAQTIRAIVSHLSANQSVEGIAELLEEDAIIPRDDAPAGLRPAHFPILHSLSERYNQKHDSKIDFYNSHNEPGYVWLLYHSNDHIYQQWLGIPRHSFQEGDPYFIFVQEFIIIFLIIAGSLLVARSIQKPLKVVSRATERFGAGEIPERIKEAGPEEVKQLARSFNHMVDDLKALQRERELMLAGISHDLRTPLTRLQLGIEMLPEIDESMRNELRADIKQITEMQQQFIDYISAGTSEQKTDTNLNELIYYTTTRFDAQLKQPIIFEQSEDNIYAYISPISIQRVLNNLITNSIKYGKQPIKVKITKNSTNITISVHDEGDGVHSEDENDIFKPLFRCDGARKNAEGSGLGLAIVKRIIEKHQGTIIAKQNGAQPGFSIEITLPVEAP